MIKAILELHTKALLTRTFQRMTPCKRLMCGRLEVKSNTLVQVSIGCFNLIKRKKNFLGMFL